VEKVLCSYCGKEYSVKGIGTHIWRSHGDGKGHTSTSGKEPWNKGKHHSEETKFKIGKSNQGKTWNHSKETKNKISNSLKGKTGGYRKGSGRGKRGWYKGFWCDSSWELAFVIYNLDHNVNFQRNTEKFQYIFDGQIHYYIPDFIINGNYIEIKGYETVQTLAKYKSCPNLKVLKEKDLTEIFEYVITKYGSDYIKLYE
jgi:hypothetical protein